MRSKRVNDRRPHKVEEVAAELAHRHGFKSVNRFVIALIIEAGMRERRLETYKLVANADDGLQDQLIDFLLAYPSDPEGIKKLMLAASATLPNKKEM